MKKANTMEKKGIASRVFSSLLAASVATCMTTVVPLSAQAVDFGKSSITVAKVAAGDTVTAYKIASASVDGSNNLKYTMATGLPEAYDTVDELAAVTSDGYSYTSNSTAMQQAAAAIALTQMSSTAAGSGVADGDGKATLSLDPGYYLLVATGTNGKTKVYQNMVVDLSPVKDTNTSYKAHEAVSFDVKSSNVEVNKKAGSAYDQTTTTSYGVGDKVPFQVTTAVPDYPSNATNATLTITDTPAKGLSLNTTGLKVMVGTEDKTGSFSISGGGTSAMTVSWNGTAADLAKLANQSVVVTYTGTVTSDALSTTDEVTKNSAKVTFNPNPYTTSTSATDPSEVTVQTYGVVFKKVDKDNNALPGAVFTIYKNGTAMKDENDQVITAESDSNGYVYFDSLAAGSYTLKETTVPSGYQACADVSVTLSTSCTSDNPATTATENNFLDMTTSQGDWVVDPDQPKLPVTGGEGTMALTIGGLALVAAAAFLLRRNRREEEK